MKSELKSEMSIIKNEMSIMMSEMSKLEYKLEYKMESQIDNLEVAIKEMLSEATEAKTKSTIK